MLAVVRLGAVHSLVFGGINIKERTGRYVLFPLGEGKKHWVACQKLGDGIDRLLWSQVSPLVNYPSASNTPNRK
jgi:hypothetical protein